MNKCKKCGAEFESSFCPNCGSPAEEKITTTPYVTKPGASAPLPARPKKRNNTGLIIGIIIVAVIIIGIFGSSNSDNTKQTVSKDTTVVKESNESKVSDKESKETTEVKEDSAKESYSVGETWQNKFMTLEYTECGEFTDYSEYSQPAEGNKIVYANFNFENVSDTDQVAMYTDFTCYADDESCQQYYGMDETGMDFCETLSAGRKCSGTVAFEVPIDAKSIEFEYDTNFWTSENIVFVYSE